MVQELQEKNNLYNTEHESLEALKQSFSENEQKIKWLEEKIEHKEHEIEELKNLNKSGGDEKDAKIKELLDKINVIDQDKSDLIQQCATKEKELLEKISSIEGEKTELNQQKEEKEKKLTEKINALEQEKNQLIQNASAKENELNEKTENKVDSSKEIELMKQTLEEKEKTIKELQQKIEQEVKEKKELIEKQQQMEQKQPNDEVNQPQEEIKQEGNEKKEEAKIINHEQEKGEKQEEEKQEEPPQQNNENVNLKTMFNTIRKVFLEYQDTVDQLENEKDTIFKNKFIQLSIQENDSLSQKYIEDIKSLVSEVNKPQNSNYEAIIAKSQEEINSLQVELNNATTELKEKSDALALLQTKIEEIQVELKNYMEISNSKDSLLNNQSESLEMYKKKIDQNTKYREDLEMKLNQTIVNYKMKEDEIDLLLGAVNGIMAKNKELYDINLKKLSNDYRQQIESYVRQYKTFK